MRTDGEIQQDVLDELTWDAAIDARNLGATVVAGVVTITGQVSAYAEKREAERLTEMIPGVRAVIVHIDVVIVSSPTRKHLSASAHRPSPSRSATSHPDAHGWSSHLTPQEC
jgi:hypothetical protein